MIQNKDSSLLTEANPIPFLDNMKKEKHIIMFDENPEYSKKIQFHFLKNGLEKGERGIYVMPEDEDIIEKEMKEYGIDVGKYKTENLLDIYHTTHTSQYPQEDPFDNLLRRILPSDSIKPCRIVGMLDFDKKTRNGMETFLRSEKKSHVNFENFDGSWMCTYSSSDIEPENRLNWVKELIKSHDSVIFTSSKGKGIAFDIK